MLIIPAIDISQGKVVRLTRGSFCQMKEYNSNPVYMAKFWQEEGAEYLHVVDLDGAAQGKPGNLQIIESILSSVTIPLEVGGGIRTKEDITNYLDMGADKVVLGTSVMKDLSFLQNNFIKSNAGKVSVSLDSGRIVFDGSRSPIVESGTSGWLHEVNISLDGLISNMVSAGIRDLNYTDRRRDGTLEGPDQEQIGLFLEIIRNKNINVVYAGGISCLEDIKKIAQAGKDCIKGIIVGKALYEEKFKLKQAQEAANVG